MKLSGATQNAMVTALYAIREWIDTGTDSEWERVESRLAEAITLYEKDAERPEGSEQFDGVTYNPALDERRLRRLLGRVFDVLARGEWITLVTLAREVRGTTASVSARIRDLKKAKHGAWIVDKRRVAGRRAIWEYRLRNADGTEIPPLRPRH